MGKNELTKTEWYHYTECGLDNVYLNGGYTIVPGGRGNQLSITNIDGLHEAIGRDIATSKTRISGKEFRFLRHELLLSQDRLARLLGVTTQTVARWEKGQVPVGVAGEAIIRKMYLESIGDKSEIRALLDEIAKLDDEIDRLEEGHSLVLKEIDSQWKVAA